MQAIYLDHNATSPIRPEVVETMARCYETVSANPASSHRLGQEARRLLEEAREGIAGMLGAETAGTDGDRLVFTSGGTEANNLAILGMARARSAARPGRLVVSAIEHPSVLEPAEFLMETGWRLDCLGVTHEGVVRESLLPGLLRPETAVVSVMLANHDTGVVQPVAGLASVCGEAGVPLHTDASQAVGRVRVDFRRLGVAAMTVAAHKFQGPLGIGALLVRADVEVRPLLYGGGQQSGLRPGTESVALAVGMHRALQLCEREHEKCVHRMTVLRDRFEGALVKRLKDVVVNGRGAERLPQTCNMAFGGLDGQVLLMALDMAGIACSLGAACSSGSAEPSPTLRAMGLPSGVVDSSLRFSLGAGTNEAEIDEAVERIVGVVERLRR